MSCQSIWPDTAEPKESVTWQRCKEALRVGLYGTQTGERGTLRQSMMFT